MKSFITYNGLALSSGGAHQLHRGSAKKIFQDVTSFLAQYTDCRQPEHVQVVMHEFSIFSFLKYCLHFGLPRFDWWNYWSIKKDLVYWNAWPSSLKRTFPLVMADDNLLLCIKWEFMFKESQNGAVIPNQALLPVLDQRKAKSSLYLRISERRKTLSAWFMLPFGELDRDHMSYLASLQSALPFDFSPKGWRCYTRSAKGNWIPNKLNVAFQELQKEEKPQLSRIISTRKPLVLVEE